MADGNRLFPGPAPDPRRLGGGRAGRRGRGICQRERFWQQRASARRRRRRQGRCRLRGKGRPCQEGCGGRHRAGCGNLPADPPQSLKSLAFNDPDGKPMTLADHAGKTLLLNLWATWCAPCRAEMPALDALQKEKGSDAFQVVAVNVDTGDDAKPKKFLGDIGIETLGYYRDNDAGAVQRRQEARPGVGPAGDDADRRRWLPDRPYERTR